MWKGAVERLEEYEDADQIAAGIVLGVVFAVTFMVPFVLGGDPTFLILPSIFVSTVVAVVFYLFVDHSQRRGFHPSATYRKLSGLVERVRSVIE